MLMQRGRNLVILTVDIKDDRLASFQFKTVVEFKAFFSCFLGRDPQSPAGTSLDESQLG